MPNRIISENLLASTKVNQLKPVEFEVYIRILLCVDDYGFFSANPVEVARAAYPRREDMTSKQIGPILELLAEVGLIVKYEYNNDEYLMVTNFINTPRAVKSKFPAPDGRYMDKEMWSAGACTAFASNLQAIASNLKTDAINMQTIAPLTVTVTETVNRNRNRKQPQADTHTLGSAGNVKLTESELEKLKQEFPDLIDEAIEYLSLYIADKGDKSTAQTHNATIRRWVIDAVKERRAKATQKNGGRRANNVGNFSQRDYDSRALDEFYSDPGRMGDVV